jgi:hypothetical protein
MAIDPRPDIFPRLMCPYMIEYWQSETCSRQLTERRIFLQEPLLTTSCTGYSCYGTRLFQYKVAAGIALQGAVAADTVMQNAALQKQLSWITETSECSCPGTLQRHETNVSEFGCCRAQLICRKTITEDRTSSERAVHRCSGFCTY